MLARGLLSIIFSVLLSIEIVLLGCKTSQIPITERSGDANFAQLLESIRAAEGLPALAAAVIIDGKIHTTAAVGTRKIHTDNWVTIDDKFLIGSCGKAITATLAATLVDEGRLDWETSIRAVFPNLKMFQEYENITLRDV